MAALKLARPRTLLIAHGVRQRPHESFYPGSTSKQKSIKPYKNLNVYAQVSQLMGSLNWASGFIPLDRLYLRPLQRHFHSLGLTDRFTPPRRSDPLVLANLLRHWQDLRFLTSGIPICTFQADFTIFTDASTLGWARSHGGFPRFRVP